MPARRNTLQPIADTWDAFYCRLSRDDDNEGDSNSIQHQKQLLERYGRDHGIEHFRYYVDDGYSGTNFNRPGFKEMLADIEAGRIKNCYCQRCVPLWPELFGGRDVHGNQISRVGRPLHCHQ